MARTAEPPTLWRFLVVSLLLAALIAVVANVVIDAASLEPPRWVFGWLYVLASAFVIGAFLALILLKPRDRRLFAIIGLREKELEEEESEEEVVVAEVAAPARRSGAKGKNGRN